jgi:hypothetical protein
MLLPLAAGRDPGPIRDTDDRLLPSAVEHGMHGLLWSWVRDHAPTYASRSTLAGADLATQRWHHRLWDTIATVRASLTELGTEFATVKGVPTEARWYARTGERPCADVDVLIAPDAWARAGEVLDALHPGHPLRRDITELVRRGVMQSVNAQVGGVPVDVHFDLFKLGIPTRQRDIVWERTRAHPLPDGTTVPVPDTEVALINFLLHLNKDSFAWLLGFADVVRILRDDQVDWGFVDRFVRAEGLDVVAYRSLTTVTERLGIPAPQVARTRGPRARTWRAVWPERVVLLGGTDANRSRRQDILPLLARGRWSDTLRWGWRISFPPASTVAVRYHDVAGPYPWRLLRGRLRTARRRRAALRARHSTTTLPAEPPTPRRDPGSTAGLLRKTAMNLPLWIDVRGRSMGRSIPDGVSVRVEAGGRPRRGDVWAFCDSYGEVIVHRCRGETRDGYRFQGDARVRADDAVATEQLIGRVVDVAPARARVRWGPLMGSVQRSPRVAISVVYRALRIGKARRNA